jgi:hypothetical protein
MSLKENTPQPSAEKNQKLLRMFHGPGGGFLEKNPLAAGGKIGKW